MVTSALRHTIDQQGYAILPGGLEWHRFVRMS